MSEQPMPGVAGGGFMATPEFLDRIQKAVEHAQTLPAEPQAFLKITFLEEGDAGRWRADVFTGFDVRLARASSDVFWAVWAMVEAVVRQQVPVCDEGNE